MARSIVLGRTGSPGAFLFCPYRAGLPQLRGLQHLPELPFPHPPRRNLGLQPAPLIAFTQLGTDRALQ
ncbi:hypothetical protein CDV36_011795 [Fusarium kuroshium]|uniref:Uncharacterized protein n=3 Tax=Fusarium solani species complex TaxID=232080 RepID=A0A3M2RTG5_9HYPO|nr:hypothetical protein CDV36_011795 [Fusarium kuroshium]RSL77663.1 hypothetical protein CEP51_008876 [Fusarium floridanum]RSM02461.1 hypothetical protein CEP52_007949 [Fusarium oligoseptatum]